MTFNTDKQTLDDLNIFGRHGSNSIFSIFNVCATRGGASVLEKMFQYPLSDAEEINNRTEIIRQYSDSSLSFPVQSSVLDAVQIYMENTDVRTKLTAEDDTVAKKFSNALARDLMTTQIKNGIEGIFTLLNLTQEFLGKLPQKGNNQYNRELEATKALLSQPVFLSLLENKAKFTFGALVKFDDLLRFRNRDAVDRLLNYLYHADVYLTVGRVAREGNFSYPTALPQDVRMTCINGLYHPQVEHAIPNDIRISPEGNVIFLTGANMAGKSTFMKSLSVAMFLAHMGFPVAAAKMEFAVMGGIYTTINLPDDLGMGASHFYAEVLRVKKISQELKNRRLFVVFDEMFRGTNVKDAAEATIAFTEAFARNRNSVFVISTHIVEAGDTLRERCPNINFVYLPTIMNGTKPVYTYKLEAGITEDRHGMIIINNEKILETLRDGLEGNLEATTEQENEGFIADKQTLQDLNLLGKYKSNSIYNLFNQVQTKGGGRLLEQMFHKPLTGHEEINSRSNLFRFFTDLSFKFPVDKEVFKIAEAYLNSGTAGIYSVALARLIVKKFQHSFLRDPEFNLIEQGLLATVEVLNCFRDFLIEIKKQDTNPYTVELQKLLEVFADPRLEWITAERKVKHFSLMKVAAYDHLLKNTLHNQMETVLNSLYRLEVYISVSGIAKERGLSYASALPKNHNKMKTSALWHPSLINGTTNPVTFDGQKNMIFLTGANMAGKSTLMKALGVAVYLAHMGFPVAAKDMEFSVREGLYSSINVHDDLNMGYSHFYAEVLRVKTVAEQVSKGKNLIVLFDELFKGTNVKDAYDGTLSVTAAFARYKKCFYIVSTHIIEVGDALDQTDENIQFAYLPTVMEGKIPRYTYQLKEGITSDRQGMMIIENEGILEML
ncbi:MutS-related protein [Pedobacter miscanthi]|uniref:MutS-related protein n=1 Tax=Pedobacter miscanthi TaxID=2259170 RepID=UPI0029300159|nr:hypothetical protein [Pedobacter miscanthi]